MRKNKILFVIALLFMFNFSIITSTITDNIKYPESSNLGDPNYIIIDRIIYESDGSALITKFFGYIYYNSTVSVTAGEYYFNFWSIRHDTYYTYIIYLNNGTQWINGPGGSGIRDLGLTFLDSQCQVAALRNDDRTGSTLRVCEVEFSIIGDRMIEPILDNYLEFYYSFYRVADSYSNAISHTITLNNSLDNLLFNLKLNLIINSSFYDIDDLKIFIQTNGTDYYTQYNYDSIVLNNYKYKLKLYDKENNLLFSDSDYQNYTFSRTIDIPSFKFQNNLDEMVNCTIKNNTDHEIVYQTFVSPYANSIINLTSGIFDLEISDVYGERLYNETFSFPSKNSITYTPPNYRECFISYSDQSLNYLDFNNYKVKINNTFVYSPNIFREINTYVNITTYDVFDRKLDQHEFLVNRQDNYFNITLEQYPLRIRNNQVYDSEIEIKLVPETSFRINVKLTSNDLVEYKLFPDTYNITYSNEAFKNTSISFNLNKASAITLNSTQKDFTISLFDESGFGVALDNVRMYYDNARTSGYIRTFDGTHNIKILDYFNTTLFDEDVDITPYTEFNVYLPIYTLIINNNYSQQMRMIIEREGISFSVVDQVIPALSSYQFRFAANLDYIVSMIYLNGTYADNRTINLASNVQIESFGYYSLADITQIDNSFSGAEIGLIIAVLAGLAFISIQSLRKPKVYKTGSPIPIPKKRTLSNNPKHRGNKKFV